MNNFCCKAINFFFKPQHNLAYPDCYIYQPFGQFYFVDLVPLLEEPYEKVLEE